MIAYQSAKSHFNLPDYILLFEENRTSPVINQQHQEEDKLWLSRLLKRPSVVLIIDDIGDNYHRGKRVVELPVSLNLAMLPNTPFAKKLADEGFNKGHDIMLHLPMEATTRPDLLGKGALLDQHSKEQLTTVFSENLAQIPHVTGFNNHMGSRLTASQQHMTWVMEYAAERGLYFVDSRTTSSSVAFETAQHWAIPSLGRDVFLDPTKDEKVIKQQFQKALKVARKRGSVVLIGHPYAKSLKVLEEEIPKIATDYNWLTTTEFLRFQQLATLYGRSLAPDVAEQKPPRLSAK
ncbi:MAG: divergent polysaccharide deacetylase family protein [Gammaproteobacteria bacterium]|nr:divergent polysaccharide deacetylase family protein [Gammaproteobacteria bacterium]